MLSGISIWQLLIILAIVIMIFGTKKLRNLGGDLGGAIKSFKGAMNSDKEDDKEDDKTADPAKPLEHQAGDKASGDTKDAEFKSTTQEHDKR